VLAVAKASAFDPKHAVDSSRDGELQSIKIGSEEIVKELKSRCTVRAGSNKTGERWLSALNVMTGFTRTVRTLWMLYLGREHLSPVVLVE